MSQILRTDGLVGNAAIKYPCRMASTGNLTLSGLQTVDGVVGAQDDRVLVKDQTTATENGIYVMDSGDWERAQDADNDGAFTEGSLVKVNNGSTMSGFWYITNTGTITIDSTSIAFARASTVLAVISAFWQTVIQVTTALASRQLLILDKKGADIVCAATIDLDAATGDLVDVTGSTGPVTAITLAEGVEKVVRFTGTPTINHGASLVLPGAANIAIEAGDFARFRGYASSVVRMVGFQRAAAIPQKVPTRQDLNSGSAATYTTPTGARQLLIRMRGGGGGGAGSASTGNTGNTGTAGTATSFNSITAAGGAGGIGTTAAGSGGAGGTGGAGSASRRIPGDPGGRAVPQFESGTNVSVNGGNGGGAGGGQTNGTAGVANSGGGGAGGGQASDTFVNIAAADNAGGGGEGEYVELVINSPAATYTYTVGAGGAAGAAGTGGSAGGAGGSGYITVEELY